MIQIRDNVYRVRWLATCFEAKLEIAAAWRAMKEQESAATDLKPSQMNFLQRSAVAERVSIVNKDPSSKVFNFLATILHDLAEYLQVVHITNDALKV